MPRVVIVLPGGDEDRVAPLEEEASALDKRAKKTVSLALSAREASAFRFLLRTSAAYCRLIEEAWKQYRRVIVRVSRSIDLPINYKSCHLVACVLWEQVEIEDALHWLSTLGGAFSNLGDHSLPYAQRAGKNAFLQMRIALRTSNPSIVKQCWLFVAMSRLQQGQLRTARLLVQHVFDVNKNESKESLRDEKIANMCKGIWSRLRYAYSLRKARCESDCLL